MRAAMLIEDQMEALRGLVEENITLPVARATAERHRRLVEIGRVDLSLARLELCLCPRMARRRACDSHAKYYCHLTASQPLEITRRH